MTRARGDNRTLDLLSWRPGEVVVKRYDEHRVRAATLRVKIARAVAETLRDCAFGRGEIADRMAEFLGERVTKHMLDAYASEARAEHSIPFVRLVALVHATGDVRPLQVAAEPFGHSVVDDRYLEWVRVGQLAEKKDEIEKEIETARRNARRGRRS